MAKQSRPFRLELDDLVSIVRRVYDAGFEAGHDQGAADMKARIRADCSAVLGNLRAAGDQAEGWARDLRRRLDEAELGQPAGPAGAFPPNSEG